MTWQVQLVTYDYLKVCCQSIIEGVHIQVWQVLLNMFTGCKNTYKVFSAISNATHYSSFRAELNSYGYFHQQNVQ